MLQQQQQTATLTKAFSEVLANLAFMFITPEPSEESCGDDWVQASIGYSGPLSGALSLCCTRGFTVILAANLLGTEPGDEEAAQKADDSIKEFMNVLCGQFVTTRFGTDGVFNLTIPAIKPLSGPPDMTPSDGPDLATAYVEGWPVQVRHVPEPL